MFEYTDAAFDTNQLQILMERALKRARDGSGYRTALSIWSPRRLLITTAAEFLNELEAIDKEDHPEENTGEAA